MYTEKQYGEKWPTVTFAAPGTACFPQDLGGIGCMNYLDDMDPTIAYENVTNYMNFFDPWASMGESIGQTCYLGKNSLNQDKSTQYVVCDRIYGYSMPYLLGSEFIMNRLTGDNPVGQLFKKCRMVTHSAPFIMDDLGKDIELNDDGTTLGGCFQYQGVSLDSGQCPADNDGIFDRLLRYITTIPAILSLLRRLLFS